MTFIIVGQPLQAQSKGGMSVYGGISALYNKDLVISPDGHGQYGYVIGADARLNSGSLYFSLGGRFIQTSLLPEEEMSFFSNSEDYSLISGRAGFGFTIIDISYTTRLRSKILVSATMPINSPSQKLDIPGYERINDSWGGLVTGIGLDYSIFTIDLEYQKGMINAYNKQPDSKYNALSLTAGFFF